MRIHACFLVLLALISGLSSPALGQADKEVVDAFESGFDSTASFRKLHQFVLASEEESRWRKIPWLNSIWDGLEASKASGKPMFIWAMNGDPLGCV